jgi:hypothetical protein
MSSAKPYLEGSIYQESITTAIRLIDGTESRLADAKRIMDDTAQTIEKSKVSIRHSENLVKRSQEVLTRAEVLNSFSTRHILAPTFCNIEVSDAKESVEWRRLS